MDEPPQNLYAKNLQQAFGYPLRFPEPKPGLPSSYEEHGLHIGDVGYVDDDGMFQVLLNICLPSDHELHQARRNDLAGLVGLVKFNLDEAPPLHNAFPSGRVICHGIQESHGDNLNHTQSSSRKFISRSTSGAILILPSGAVRQNLIKSKEEEFRKLAGKCALKWCQFAGCNSLYLITGFYKTSSWYLASFHDTRSSEQILLERDGAGRYKWNPTCDYRESSMENRNDNQTVLISGFKIEVRGWDQHAVVEKLAPRSRSIWSEMKLLASFLLGILIFFWRRIVSRYVFKLHGTLRDIDGGVRVNRVPRLSQPFHPSDVINRYLLDKNPNIRVAVTHDSQWLSMLEKNELPAEDMTEEGRFRAFLEENYTDGSHSDNVVYLRRKIDGPDSEDYGDLHKSALSPKTFSLPTSDNIRHIVVTHMRVENAVTCLRRMPVGFYVAIQFDDTKRRSKTKRVSLRDSVIEWKDEIILPMDSSAKVRLSVNASFELEPMLGNGETLCMSETSVGGLAQAGSTYIPFSSRSEKVAPSSPSLLITVEERQFDCFVDWSHGDGKGYEDRSCVEVAKATDEGYSALLRYHRDHGVVELEKSIEHFTLASDLCPPDHECRAATLFNLATARFLNCQVHGTDSDLDPVIDLYRKALALRPAPLPDRPGTLLHLAQALLYRCGMPQCESSVAGEIERLVAEVKEICHEGSYEHLAADLVVQTLKRHQILTSGKLVELDELVSELDRSTRTPPNWYFDGPYRMVNLGAALRRHFEFTGNLDHLEKSISVIEEAVQLVSDGHFDKPRMLVFLGDVLCVRFVRRGHAADLDRSISTIEDALKLTPDGHVGKPWMITRLGVALLARFICGHVSDLKMSISITGSAVHLAPKAQLLRNLSTSIVTGTQSISDLSDLELAISSHRVAAEFLLDGNPHRPGCLANLASSLLIRFWCLGDPSDLEEAVLRHKDAVKLIPNGHPDKPDYLNNLALSLRARFECRGDLSDLKEATSRHKDAVELIPNGHPDKPSHLNNFGSCFVTCYELLSKSNDVEEAISTLTDAVKLTPDDHPDKPSRLNNLALSFRARSKRLGEMHDIEEAISSLMDAIKLTPDGHPDKPSHLNDLALTLKARFEHLGKLTELKFLRAVKVS